MIDITFKDLFQYTGAENSEVTPYIISETNNSLGDILESFNLISIDDEIFTDKYMNKLFIGLCQRFWNRAVIKKVDTQEEYDNAIIEVFLKVYNEILFTKTYYSVMLDNYDNQAGNFIKQITSSNEVETRNSDTPQEKNLQIDNRYISYYSKVISTNSADTSSVMGRLKELEINFMDVWSSWLDHFNKFVIE